MQNSQREVLATLVGAQEFFDDHPTEVGGLVTSGARKNLDAVVSAITAHLSAQSDHKMSARTLTRSKRTARRSLVLDHLGMIAAVARAELPLVPELVIVRSLPKAGSPIGTLLTRAQDVVKAVTPFAATFIAGGLPADFLAQLQGAVDAVAQIHTRKNASVDKRRGATVGIKAQLVAGRRQIDILNKQVRAALHGADPALYKEWKARTARPRAKQALVAVPPVTPPVTPPHGTVTPATPPVTAPPVTVTSATPPVTPPHVMITPTAPPAASPAAPAVVAAA